MARTVTAPPTIQYQQHGNEINCRFRVQPKQEEFFDSYNDRPETIYGLGGSRGGSKSWIIRNLMLQRRLKYARTPGVIIMKLYDDLLDNHIRPMLSENPQLAKHFNKNEKILTLPNGSFIRFISAEHYDDIFKLYGKEFADVMVDQSEKFFPEQLEFLNTVNRCTTNDEIVPKQAWSFNPGGPGHAFHKRLFIKREFINNELATNYYFLKMQGWDNVRWVGPWLKEQGITEDDYYDLYSDEERFQLFIAHSSYGQKLFSLDDSKRRAQLYGDFDVFEGQFFDMWRDEYHRLSPQFKGGAPPEGWPVLGGMDYGQQTVLELLTRDYEGNIIVFGESSSDHNVPDERFTRMAKLLMERKLYRLEIVCDTNMTISLEHIYGSKRTPLDIAEEVFKREMGDKAPILTIVAKHSVDKNSYRIACNETTKSYLGWQIGPDGKLTQKPRLYISDDCPGLLRTLPDLMYPDANKVGARKDGLDFDDKQSIDHWYDAMKMPMMVLYTPRKVEKEVIKSYDELVEKRIFKPIMDKVHRPRIGADSL